MLMSRVNCPIGNNANIRNSHSLLFFGLFLLCCIFIASPLMAVVQVSAVNNAALQNSLVSFFQQPPTVAVFSTIRLGCPTAKLLHQLQYYWAGILKGFLSLLSIPFLSFTASRHAYTDDNVRGCGAPLGPVTKRDKENRWNRMVTLYRPSSSLYSCNFSYLWVSYNCQRFLAHHPL